MTANLIQGFEKGFAEINDSCLLVIMVSITPFVPITRKHRNVLDRAHVELLDPEFPTFINSGRDSMLQLAFERRPLSFRFWQMIVIRHRDQNLSSRINPVTERLNIRWKSAEHEVVGAFQVFGPFPEVNTRVCPVDYDAIGVPVFRQNDCATKSNRHKGGENTAIYRIWYVHNNLK